MAWAPGTCSAAVYLRASEDRAEVLARLTDINTQCLLRGGRLVASLVHALKTHADDEPSAYDTLYPVNTLRNVAMEEAASDLVFVLDVDFIPSCGLHDTLVSHEQSLDAFLTPDGDLPRALVIPAFEVQESDTAPATVSNGATCRRPTRLPRNYGDLSGLGTKASGFHTGHFPKGHRATNFTQWSDLVQSTHEDRPWSYAVQYEEFFEPYVVLSRKHAPRFDERFRGYGLNKCSFLRHCHALGFRFEVLAQDAHFVVAAEHPHSPSWEHTYGAKADPAESLKLALLWRLFLRGLPDAPSESLEDVREVRTRNERPWAAPVVVAMPCRVPVLPPYAWGSWACRVHMQQRLLRPDYVHTF